MVVEDELLLRLDLANQFHSAGFEVIESQRADDALKLLATKVDVDLILTDIRMPGQVAEHSQSAEGYRPRSGPGVRMASHSRP